jgi:DNA processing protein
MKYDYKTLYYYVWLSNLYQIKFEKIDKLIKLYGNLERLYNEKNYDIFKMVNFSEKDKGIFIRSKNKECIQKQLECIINRNVGVLYLYDDSYPSLLKEIYNPPLVLYYKGNIEALKVPSISIVGCRNCTNYGAKSAYMLSKIYSSLGICITSGMARGIDTWAHKACIENKAYTIAVLGNGIDMCYPEENINIMNGVIQYGTVITEFPLGTKPLSINFPRRNRIISGLSYDIVIVEAKKRSGSLITAQYALEQNKNIYALPGNVDNENSYGCNYLIKNGAIILDKFETIKEESYMINQFLLSKNINISQFNKLIKPAKIKFKNEKHEKVYKILYVSKNIYQIANEISTGVQDTMRILAQMEIEGLVAKNNNYYSRSGF